MTCKILTYFFENRNSSNVVASSLHMPVKPASEKYREEKITMVSYSPSFYSITSLALIHAIIG